MVSEATIQRVFQVAICMAVVVMGSVVVLSFAVFLPRLATAFGAQVGTVSIGITLATLAVAICSPLVGRLLDRRSTRSVLTVGGILLIVGLMGASFANSVAHVLACYLLLGVAVAIFAPMVVVKHTSDWFPDRMGLATGLVVLPVGAVLFPPLTQWLIGEFGWRQTFQIYAAATFAVVLLVWFVREAPTASPGRGDVKPDGQTVEGSPLRSIEIYGVLVRSGMFWFGIVSRCVFLAGPGGVLAHLVVVARSKGLEATDGVFLLSIMGFASVIGAPLSGLIADRLGLRNGFVILALAQGVSLVLLSSTNSYLALVVCVIILGFFFSTSFIFFAGYSRKVIGGKNFGTGYGLGMFITLFVASFPPTIAGILYDHFGHYDIFFGTLAALVVFVGVGAWLIGEPRQVSYGYREQASTL